LRKIRTEIDKRYRTRVP